MSAHLPEEFVRRLGGVLGEELPEFLAALAARPVHGLRINTRKATRDGLERALGLRLEPVSWCPTGFVVPGSLGAHLAHRAGLFYLQEPSAMGPAEALGEQPGAVVADLAAAPGGKTTRLAELVGSDGLVAANDVDGRRLRSLHDNLDRWGADNVVTMSLSIDRLAAIAPEAFDAAVLDAPCSGEGLFRRDRDAVREWSPAAVRGAARRQARLLADAARLVRPDGLLIYSTCTFAVEENEERVAVFLAEHPDWEVEDAAAADPAFARGVDVAGQPTERTALLWPHRLRGEGHFVARLRRHRDAPGRRPARRRASDGTRRDPRTRAAWETFRRAHTPGLRVPEDLLVTRDDRIYLRPAADVPLPSDVLVRPGVSLGRARPGRFEPAQALAGLLAADAVSSVATWPDEDPRWAEYLGGAEIPDPGPDAWVLVCAHGWGIGWARRRGGVLKNFLPRALRTRA
ncbi:MAG: rRNA methyltransferase [Streptosporangiales bacterium]|nr:rRNA methyltransferase [Streptosporangiales bacterium]